MRILRRHLVSRLLAGYLIAALSLGCLLWLLELLQRLEEGVGRFGELLNAALSALLIVPEGLVDLLPVIAILATAAIMGGFQSRNELTVMRAAGVSVWRLTSVALIPGFGLALVALVALQWVTPMIQPGPDRLVGSSLGESGLWHPSHGLWVRQGNDFLNIQSLHLGRIPTDINLYQFDEADQLRRQISAEQALIFLERDWQLESVTVREYDEDGIVRIETHERLSWQSFLSASQLELLLAAPASLPLTDLWRYVADLRNRGQDMAEYEVVLWRRLALPLACLGMVLAAMATATMPLKRRGVSIRLAGAVVLGLSFQLVGEMSAYLGLLLGWPALPVALGPPAALALLAWWLLARAR